MGNSQFRCYSITGDFCSRDLKCDVAACELVITNSVSGKHMPQYLNSEYNGILLLELQILGSKRIMELIDGSLYKFELYACWCLRTSLAGIIRNILNDPPHKISSKMDNFWMYYSQISFGC